MAGWRQAISSALGRTERADQVELAPYQQVRTSEEEEGWDLGEPSRQTQGQDLLPGPPPNASQAVTLRRVPASIPFTTYAIALVELAERASFYGVVGISANFIQRPLPPGGPGTGAPASGSEATAGALGMGLQVATGLTVLFTILGYTTPLLGGALADMRWGKFRTIMIGVILVTLAHAAIVYSALPSLLQSGTAFLPFLIAMLLLCSSTGLIKANVAPIMAEQYTPPGDYVETLPSGELVIVDREATVQRIMSAYYGSINVGAFLAVGSSFAEKYVGFWLAFLIPGLTCLMMPFILLAIRPALVPAPPPSQSPLKDIALLFNASKSVKADDTRREEVKGAIEACKFFLFFSVYNVADGGLYSLFNSLAGSMTTKGVPNDFLGHANPLAIVITIPLLNRYGYPWLQCRGVAFGPVKRVVVGFIMSGLAMLWCAFLQYLVYRTSPCGYEASTCGSEVSPLSAWLVIPTPIILGISECIAVVSAMEIGYLMSPPGMRSIVNAVFLFTQTLSAILVLFLMPIMRDPHLVWPFMITAIAVIVASWGVWRFYGHLDYKTSSFACSRT